LPFRSEHRWQRKAVIVIRERNGNTLFRQPKRRSARCSFILAGEVEISRSGIFEIVAADEAGVVG
jgi:hypothetical protein